VKVRAVTQPEPRLAEAEKLGFKNCLLPAAHLKRLTPSAIVCQGASSVQEALQLLA